MNYSQFIYLILSLLCAYAAFALVTNNNLVNSITGNKSGPEKQVNLSEGLATSENTIASVVRI